MRGFLAGAVRKKLGLTLVSEKPDAGPRRYRSDHGLNAMDQDSTCVLAEHGVRTAHPAEADLPQGKATDEAACDGGLSRMLEALPALSPAELRSEWRRLYRSQPPRLSRDLLIRAVAYRIQELRYGGLKRPDGSLPRSWIRRSPRER